MHTRFQFNIFRPIPLRQIAQPRRFQRQCFFDLSTRSVTTKSETMSVSSTIKSKKRSLSEAESTTVTAESKETNPCKKAKKNQRGVFVVFEGIDRSGKTSQSEMLQSYLSSQNIPFKHMRFPDRSTEIGKVIDAYLRSSVDLDDRAIHLLFSANRHAVRAQMETLLNNGTHIICDRYTDSGVAYSFGKNRGKSLTKHRSKQHSTETIIESDEKSSVKITTESDNTTTMEETNNPSLLSWQFCTESDEGLIQPDRVIFMDITVDQVKKRGGFGDERYEKEEFLAAVLDAYHKLIDADPSRYHKLEATLSKEELHAQVVRLFEQTMLDCADKPIQHLRL